jgi:hypothetical protein
LCLRFILSFSNHFPCVYRNQQTRTEEYSTRPRSSIHS